jgi:hypothetical protein
MIANALSPTNILQHGERSRSGAGGEKDCTGLFSPIITTSGLPRNPGTGRSPKFGLLSVLSGQEVETRELGHVLVYGADISLERHFRGCNTAAVPERREPRAVINIPPPETLRHPLTDGIEIFIEPYRDRKQRGAEGWQA